MFMLVKFEKCNQALCWGSSLDFFFFLISHIAFSYLYQLCLFLLCLFVAWPIAQSVDL